MKAQTAAIFGRDTSGPLETCRADIQKAFAALSECFASGHKLLVCGNGGSASDSEHIIGELMKGFAKKRPLPEAHRSSLRSAFPAEGAELAEKLQGALPAICLASQTSLCTAVANDVSFDLIFAQQVYGYGKEGDVVLGISTSGLAANVLAALRTARAFGMKTLGLTGQEGGRMEGLCDVTIKAPARSASEVQAHHTRIYHTLCAMLEEEFF